MKILILSLVSVLAGFFFTYVFFNFKDEDVSKELKIGIVCAIIAALLIIF